MHKAKSKKRPYGILTTGSWRVEVQARNLTEAYREAKKELEKINKSHDLEKLDIEKQDLTSAYQTYGSSGISTEGFKVTPKSVKLAKKYNLGVARKSPLEARYGVEVR